MTEVRKTVYALLLALLALTACDPKPSGSGGYPDKYRDANGHACGAHCSTHYGR